MKKVLLGLLLVFGLTACGEKTEAPKENTKPVVKIGAIFPLSGDSAEAGNDLKNATIKMMEQYNNGPIKYEVIFEDNQSGSAMKSISAIKKLVYIDKVTAVISSFSAAAQAIAPIIENENVIQIALVTDLDPKKYKKIFSMFSSVEEDARTLVELMKKQNVKKVVSFVQQMPAQISRFEHFETEAEKNGIEVTKIDVISGNRNFNMDITKISTINPDMVAMFVVVPELDIIAKQMKDAGLNIPKTSIEGISFSANKEALFENSTYIEGHHKQAEIIEKIKDEINSRGSIGFVYIYDSLTILTNTINNFYETYSRIPSGDELASIIEKIDLFSGVAGDVYRKDHRFFGRSGIRKIINGQPVIVEE